MYSFTGHAQTHRIDSLKKALETRREDTGTVATLNILGQSLLHQNKLSEAKLHLREAKLLSDKINYETGKAIACLNLGFVYDWEFNYPEALKELFEGLEISERINNKSLSAGCLQLIGGIYSTQDNQDDALKYFLEALHYNNETLDKQGAAQNLNSIGETFTKQGSYSKALMVHLGALAIYKASGTAIADWALPWTYESIANAYRHKADSAVNKGDKEMAGNLYDSAQKNYLISLDLWKKTGNQAAIAELYVWMGSQQIQLKNLPAAKDYLEKALALSLRINDKPVLRDSYNELSILYKMQGNFQLAYDYYTKYIRYRDSLSNDESTKKSLTYKLQFEFDKKEAIAKATQEKKDADVRRARNLQFIALGIFILLAGFLFWSRKQKQNANSKIEKAYGELKATQTQLVLSEKMASLGELTAGIAHEIQNPLNFVNNFSDVSVELLDEMITELKSSNTTDAIAIAGDVKENLEKILHHGKRADGIVKGMLQHSRSSSGEKEPTDINKLVDEYLRLAYHGLRAKDNFFNVAMRTDYDENMGRISTTPQDIGRVILNLITNAFYAVTERKKQEGASFEPAVLVSTKKLEGKAEIRVRDNGYGIPQKVLEKIFQPFFTTKPTGQGTGLGLSLSYDIVKAHGGEIKVETKENEGTEFIIQLPVISK